MKVNSENKSEFQLNKKCNNYILAVTDKQNHLNQNKLTQKNLHEDIKP